MFLRRIEFDSNGQYYDNFDALKDEAHLNRLIELEKTYLGAIAQLVEHLHGMQGVSGSSPLGSTIFSKYKFDNV